MDIDEMAAIFLKEIIKGKASEITKEQVCRRYIEEAYKAANWMQQGSLANETAGLDDEEDDLKP